MNDDGKRVKKKIQAGTPPPVHPFQIFLLRFNDGPITITDEDVDRLRQLPQLYSVQLFYGYDSVQPNGTDSLVKLSRVPQIASFTFDPKNVDCAALTNFNALIDLDLIGVKQLSSIPALPSLARLQILKIDGIADGDFITLSSCRQLRSVQVKL